MSGACRTIPAGAVFMGGMIDNNLLGLPGARRAFGLLLVCAFVDAVLIAFQALGLAQAVVVVWSGDSLGAALPFVAIFAGAYLARRIVAYGRNAFMERFARKTVQKLRADILDATYAQGVAGVQARGTGAAAALLVEGVDAVRTYIAILFPKVTDLMMIPTVLTVVLFGIDWVSGLIALVVLPCIIAYMRLLGARAKANAASQFAEYNFLSNHFIDTLRGMSTLKAFGRSKPYAKQVFAVSERFRKATIKTIRTATLSSLVLDLFRTFALAAVAIMLGFRLLDGSMALLNALAVLIIVPEYFAAVRRFSTDFHASLDGRNNLAEILAVIGKAKAQRESEAVEAFDKIKQFRLNKICFSYDSREGSEAEQQDRGEAEQQGSGEAEQQGRVERGQGELISALQGQGQDFSLHDISLEFAGTERIGLVGLSGSGKSTLARLIAGFANPTEGSFEINGKVCASLARSDWLRHVTYIPQDPYIFSDTLRNNVAFYVPDASDKDVERAIMAAGLDALVAQLPEGMNTLIGAGGRQLSGGQAQRVALARAFLDDGRRVLVFDEPTAHLDIETELALKENMLKLMEGRLVIFATHRLHWMQNMDTVVVLDEGRVLEVGAPGEVQLFVAGECA